MGRIGLSTLKETVAGVADDAKVRLGSAGEPKTAKRSFLGRAVRWMFGATKRDRADNKKLMGDLLSGLKAKYGAEVGARAFLKAVPGAQLRDDGIYARTGKPLSARQVRTAVADAKASPLRFAPGGDRFAQAVARSGVRADQLTSDQEQYIKSRLNEYVALSAHQGRPLSSGEVERYAAKLLKHTANNVGDSAAGRNRAYSEAKKAAGQTVLALAGFSGRVSTESPPELLLKLARACEGVVSDSMLDAGDVGGQDIADAKLRVIKSAVDRLTPGEARELYQRAMAPDGTGVSSCWPPVWPRTASTRSTAARSGAMATWPAPWPPCSRRSAPAAAFRGSRSTMRWPRSRTAA